MVIVYLRFKIMFSFTFFFLRNSLRYVLKYTSQQQGMSNFYHTLYLKHTHQLHFWYSQRNQKLAKVAIFKNFWIGLPKLFTSSCITILTEPNGGQCLILTVTLMYTKNAYKLQNIFTEPKWGPVIKLFSRIKPGF